MTKTPTPASHAVNTAPISADLRGIEPADAQTITDADHARRINQIGPTILLVTGRYFSFVEPCSLTVEEVAHALAHICRFTGHTGGFYSVAQHSVLVSRLVPNHLARHALMHDAVEAVVGDVSGPLKRLIPDYKAIEDRCEEAILAGFGLSPHSDPLIKRADLVALRTEQRDLMHRNGGLWTSLSGIEPAAEIIVPMTPVEAKAAFIVRAAELGFDVQQLAAPASPIPQNAPEVDLPDVEDMAHSAVQEALIYGVSHDVFHRWMRAVMDKTIGAMRAAQAQQDAPAAVAVNAALRDVIEAIEYTPLGVRALQALTRARTALATSAAPASQDAQDAANLPKPAAWINQRCIVREGECAGHEPPELSFKRYGDWSKSVALFTDQQVRALLDAALAAQQAGEKAS